MNAKSACFLSAANVVCLRLCEMPFVPRWKLTAGVGKSAIVEGLALRIMTDEAGALRGKRIITLDIASMVAGTTYRGQFEERMKQVISELHNHPEVILFIDEIHTIIGAGNAQGSLDAANILKPALARGEVQCIGATTTAEYAK